MKQRMKRILSFVLLASMMVTVLVSCNSDSPSSSKPQGSEGESSQAEESQGETLAPAEISMLLNQSWNKDGVKAAVKAFEEANEGMTVDLQAIPDEQFSNLLRSKIASQQMPDMVYETLPGMKKEVDVAEIFVDLSDQAWVSRITNPAAATIDDKVYAFPVGAAGGYYGIVYNTEMFDRLQIEVPKTLDEYYAACDKLKAEGITPVFMSGKDDWTIGMWNVTLFASIIETTPDLTVEDLNEGKVKHADVAGFKDTLNVMKKLVDDGYLNSDYLSATYDMAMNAMMDETAGMYLMSDGFIAEMAEKKPEADHYRMFPFPITDDAVFACSPGTSFFISASSPNVEACKKLLDTFAEPEHNLVMSQERNFIPGMKDVSYEYAPATQDIVDNYVNKGEAIVDEWGVTCAISIGEMTKLTTELLMGSIDADTVMTEWDTRFAALAKERELPGWT